MERNTKSDIDLSVKTIENEISSDLNNNGSSLLDSGRNAYKVTIVWRNVFGMVVLHLLAIYGFCLACLGYGKFYQFLIMWTLNFLGGFSILAGAHRLWAHRTYKANLGLRIFLAIFQTMAVQNDIFEWCRDHRVHHKYSETDADPHNANRGFFFAHMGWLLCKKHPDVKEKGKTVDMSDLWADPVVRYQRRFYIPLIILFRIIIFMVWPTYAFSENQFHAICANAFCYVGTLHHTWLVNSAAHLYGHKPYDKHMGPRDNRKVVYLTMGEGYHNYHHTFPYDYSASEYGWDENFNPATAFIDFCCWMGWAWDRKKPSEETIVKRMQRTGDISFKMEKRHKINYWIDMLCGIAVMFWPFIIVYSIRPFFPSRY